MSSNPSPEAMSAAERLCNGRRIFIDDGGWCDASEIAEIIDAAYAERLERLERENEQLRLLLNGEEDEDCEGNVVLRTPSEGDAK